MLLRLWFWVQKVKFARQENEWAWALWMCSLKYSFAYEVITTAIWLQFDRATTIRRPTTTRNSAIADKPRDAFWGQSTKHSTIPYVRYGFLLVCFVRFWDILLQKCRDLENLVKDPWRLLKLTPFDTDPMTSYWCMFYSNYDSISCRFWDVQCRKNIETLKSHSRANQGHWKLYHFIDWVWFPISVL